MKTWKFICTTLTTVLAVLVIADAAAAQPSAAPSENKLSPAEITRDFVPSWRAFIAGSQTCQGHSPGRSKYSHEEIFGVTNHCLQFFSS